MEAGSCDMFVVFRSQPLVVKQRETDFMDQGCLCSNDIIMSKSFLIVLHVANRKFLDLSLQLI